MIDDDCLFLIDLLFVNDHDKVRTDHEHGGTIQYRKAIENRWVDIMN